MARDVDRDTEIVQLLVDYESAVCWAQLYEEFTKRKDDNGKTYRLDRDTASGVAEFLFPGTQRRMQRGELRTIRAQKILRRKRAVDE
mgnify:FL=1